MYLKEYLKTIQQNFSTHISEEELFRLLFDSIIIPLNLTGSNGEPLDYSKSYISSILNRHCNIPSILRDNYYNPTVIDGMREYFEQNILSELIPAKEEICYQMMNIVKDDPSISPQGKLKLQMVAHPSTLSVFLAQLFGYVINANATHTVEKTAQNETSLKILCIDKSNNLCTSLCLKNFSPKHKNIQTDLNNIDNLINEIKNMPYDSRPRSHGLLKFPVTTLQTDTPIKISNEEISIISRIAESRNLELSPDFFELGDLYTPFGLNSPIYNTIKGGNNSKIKYERFRELLDIINQLKRWSPIEEFFSQFQCVDLVLENSGLKPQQDVSVTLTFPESSLFTADALYNTNSSIIRLLIDNFDISKLLGIPGTQNYLNYDDAISGKRMHYVHSPFPTAGYTTKAQIVSDFKRQYMYKIYSNEQGMTLQIDFPEIMQHSAIAFPASILLREGVSKIDYTLKSRNLPHMLSGTVAF